MPKHNRKCLNCGTPYYACSACIGINSWKNICCSVECYREFVKKLKLNKVAKPQEENIGEVKDMYIILNNNEKVQVIGYDLELGRIDGEDGKTYVNKDIDHFEISLEELQDIVEDMKNK